MQLLGERDRGWSCWGRRGVRAFTFSELPRSRARVDPPARGTAPVGLALYVLCVAWCRRGIRWEGDPRRGWAHSGRRSQVAG